MKTTSAAKINVQLTHPLARIPSYATPGAAGFDLHAVDGTFIDNVPRPVDTGVAMEIPAGHVVLLFSRSGHTKNGVRLANCVGVIDSDYRGSIKAVLVSDFPEGFFHIRPGDRIAQGVLIKADQVDFNIVDQLSPTERGDGGFGSTGK